MENNYKYDMDKIEATLKEMKNHGHYIPNKKMIKNERQILGIIEASKINSLILDAVEKQIHIGMTTKEIDEIVERETKRLGGLSAPKVDAKFPGSACYSVNNQVCHGVPNNRKLQSGDIINVDCTTIYKGYYGDASRMFMIGDVDPVNQKLVRVTKECLDLAVSHLKPYCHLGDIGYYVSKHAEENGFSVVEEFGGHGVGLKMHEDPFVCHTGKLDKGMVLAPGMVITIEPMINAGKRNIYINENDGWSVYTDDGSFSAQWEYTILITETGCEILSK